jgi:hypothetical protein
MSCSRWPCRLSQWPCWFTSLCPSRQGKANSSSGFQYYYRHIDEGWYLDTDMRPFYKPVADKAALMGSILIAARFMLGV